MSFMRLGTRIAVIDDHERILLSKRGDFGVWALPGGRVDSGELLIESAIREAREETGIEVEIVRPIGLYFQQGRSRMNILYRAKPIGGELFASTDETLDNRFFMRSEIPTDLFGQFYIDHAYSDETYLYTQETSTLDLLKIDLKLRWRWIQNFFAGRPEPKFTQFDSRAFGVIWNDGQVYTENNQLPSIVSDGQQALPTALSKHIGTQLDWQWVGVWQNPTQDRLDFVFHAKSETLLGGWQTPDILQGRFAEYLTQSKTVWHRS